MSEIKASEISVLGRNTQGITLMRTSDGGKVVSIEKVNDNDTEEIEKEDEKNK